MKKFFILAIVAIFSLSAFAQKSTVQTVTIQTNGVCQKCADRFSENVPYFKGVKSYTYDMKTAKLTINYDSQKTNPDQLRKEVSKLGFNADNVKADAAARANLPACCRGEKSCSDNGQGKSGEHKCQHAQGDAHQCNHQCQGKEGEHKCQHAQGNTHQCNHQCQGQSQNGEHKCNHQCQGHK